MKSKKIDILINGKYACTTEQSKTCKEAVRRYLEKFTDTKGKVTAHWQVYK